jgi:uncharacterized protein (DUF342 family)
MPIIVQVSADGMEAIAEIRRENDDAVGIDALSSALSDAGVSFGIDSSACESLLSELNSLPVGQPFRRQVAKGVLPINGTDGRLDMAVESSREAVGVADDSGNVDFREHGAYTPIEKGELIATIIPPSEATRGRTVRGEEAEGQHGAAAKIISGAGTGLVEGGTELRATRNGDLRCNDDRIEVSDVIRVSGNLDFEIGNIECEGEVRVSGDVLSGFQIKARGDVTIGGVVESAEVESQGTVTIRHGAVRSSRIRAAAVVIGYVSSSYVESDGDVRIQKESVMSTIVSGGSITIAPSGRAVGGSLHARDEIDIGVAGSARGVDKLVLGVGVEPFGDLEAARLAIHGQRAEKARTRIAQVREIADSEHEPELAKMVSEQTAKVEESEVKLAKLTDPGGQAKRDCYIKVARKIYAGVQLQIGESQLTIDEERSGGTFRIDPETGEIGGSFPPSEKK